MNKKVNWTRNDEIQLIQEMRERPILWDISHPQYNRSDLKAIGWEKVAETLCPQITSNLAKERFENLRTTFMRNEKKIKNSTSSGKGTDDIYKPKWDLYPLLMFLRKTTVQATSVSNLDVDADNATMSICSEPSKNIDIASSIYCDKNLQQWLIPKDTQIIETEIRSETLPSISSFLETSESNLSSSSSTRILSETFSNPCRPASASETTSTSNITNTKRFSTESDHMYVKRGKKSSNACVMEEAIAAIKDLSKENTLQADAYDHFGAYVAAQLRMLTPEHRANCEIEIVKILSRQN